MTSGSAVRTAIRAVLQSGADATLPDDAFNRHALNVFAHQFTHNQPYRKFCERRGRTPDTVTQWPEIPAVPTAAFKEVALVAGEPADARAVFRTSGTTRGTERRGTHYILDPDLYEAALLPAFQRFVLNGETSALLLSLVPPREQQPDSSLSYMISTVVREFGADGSGFFASVRGGIDVQTLRARIAAENRPVVLLATSLAMLHLLDGLAGETLPLPAGSRIMDTGGFKGASRSITPNDLRAQYQTFMNVAPDHCINEYGMTELCSQYYGIAGGPKAGPPWLRARVVDPENLAPLPAGQAGIIQHFDLANLDSVAAVQTEDLGVQTGNGFVLLGRAPGATPRGCSIAMDILLADHTP